MRIKPKLAEEFSPDMTPMIDIVFQLIAFFMMVSNMSNLDADERIRLPVADQAKPSPRKPKERYTINVDRSGNIIDAGREHDLAAFEAQLKLEKKLTLRANPTVDPNALPTIVIIRADREAEFDRVQEIIEVCKKNGYYKFIFKAKQPEF